MLRVEGIPPFLYSVEDELIQVTSSLIMRLLYSGVQPPYCRPLGLTRPGCDRLRATPCERSWTWKICITRYQLERLSFLWFRKLWAKCNPDKEERGVESAPASGAIYVR